MIPAAPESTNAVPFDNVKVCPASVYTGTSSTVALNSNFKGAVVANSCASVRIELPSLRNNPTVCTGLESVPAFEPFNDIPFAPTLLPCGSVAPLAAISRFPDPSDFIMRANLALKPEGVIATYDDLEMGKLEKILELTLRLFLPQIHY